MLKIKPANNYEEEIKKNFNDILYTEDYLLWTGGLGHFEYRGVNNDENGNYYRFAILDDDKLIGYISYAIDWYSSCAYNFGLISFDKGNVNVAIALYRLLDQIINEYHIHRIDYRMVGGNPVKRHYDRFCEKYNGRCIEFRDCFKDRTGKYRNEYVYEIIL